MTKRRATLTGFDRQAAGGALKLAQLALHRCGGGRSYSTNAQRHSYHHNMNQSAWHDPSHNLL
jgi:hypothetical protein